MALVPPLRAPPPAYSAVAAGAGGGGLAAGAAGGVAAGAAAWALRDGDGAGALPEMRLFADNAERRKMESLGDLYSIIKAVEHLEASFVRDAVTSEDYTRECAKLISQFKTLETALRAEGAIGDTEGFMREYSMYAACAARARAARGAPHRSCSRASERLLRAGVPATVIHRSFDDRGVAVSVAEAVSCFITAMDGLKLNLRAVDEIQPLLSDLMASLGKIHSLEADAACKTKVAEWLVALNGMRASASVGEEQVRQMLFDLDQAYSAFTASLGRK